MKVTVIEDNMRPGQVMAMIESRPAFFQRGTVAPALGAEVEVMICSVKHPRVGDYVDATRVSCFIIRAIDEEAFAAEGLVKAWCQGFETSGSGCSTVSEITEVISQRQRLATPGRVGVAVAENVNPGWSKKLYKLTPVQGWLEYVKGRSMPRLVGVMELSHLQVYSKREFVPYVDKYNTYKQVEGAQDGV